jgi:hypothetical protein
MAKTLMELHAAGELLLDAHVIDLRHASHNQADHAGKKGGGRIAAGESRPVTEDGLVGAYRLNGRDDYAPNSVKGQAVTGEDAGEIKALGAREVAGQMSESERQAVADELNALPSSGPKWVNTAAEIRDEEAFKDLRAEASDGRNAMGLDEEMPLGVGLQAATVARQMREMGYEESRKIESVMDDFQGVRGEGGHHDPLKFSADLERLTGETPASGLASAINRGWSDSSQSVTSVAMQLEIAAHRGDSSYTMARGGTWPQRDNMQVPSSMGWLGSGHVLTADQLRSTIPTSLSSVRSATQKQTAAVLDSVGLKPTDTVTLYRGASDKTITRLGGQPSLEATSAA